MRNVTLGSTGIVTPQNGFGALPIQRVDDSTAVHLLQKAYENGFVFFDTARAYSDSEHKVGLALSSVRDKITLATKTGAKDTESFWKDLNTSLKLLKTDCIDIYQFHCVDRCYRPDDGTGMYEAMLEAKRQGMIRHIGITAHKIGIAEEISESGLYEILQFPFSYLATDRDMNLVKKCYEKNIGFIGMKGLSGGLLTNSAACMAFISMFPGVVPIWGIQRESELDEWIGYFKNTPELDSYYKSIIETDRKELLGDFCRGCGYCMPCTSEIIINQCARMSQMIRRSPSDQWLSDFWQKEMNRIDDCVECGICKTRCPYSLDIPALLKKNLEDYKKILDNKEILR